MGKALVFIIIVIGLIGYFNRPGPQTAAATARPAAPLVTTAEAVSDVVLARGANWRLQTSKSAIDDTTSVYLTTVAQGLVRGRFGNGPAELTLRCHENTTALTLRLADNFMADLDPYGRVTYRIDQREARTKGFQESTSNEVLGLWSGGASIPFIKGMFGGSSMVVRATPFNENPIEATFDISGLEERIAPLREACHW